MVNLCRFTGWSLDEVMDLDLDDLHEWIATVAEIRKREEG